MLSGSISRAAPVSHCTEEGRRPCPRSQLARPTRQELLTLGGQTWAAGEIAGTPHPTMAGRGGTWERRPSAEGEAGGRSLFQPRNQDYGPHRFFS